MTDIDLSEIRDELRAVTRGVVADRSPVTRVRELCDDPLGFDESLWSTAADLGWLGLEIAEEYGGSAMTFQELGVILEELGRGLVPLPMLSCVVLGAGAISAAGTDQQRSEWLPAIASGERRLTAAIAGPTGSCDAADLTVRAVRSRRRWRIDGVAAHVPDAHRADAIIVAVSGERGPSLLLVDRMTDGVTVEVTPTYDQTRRLCEVRFDSVDMDGAALIGEEGGAETLIRWLVDRAGVALALDSHGGARAAMEMSVEYAKQRVQFDRPIGSFQAVKHRCADMFVAVEGARIAARTGARALSAVPGPESPWPAIAKSYATEAYARVAGWTIDVHGGIGFTWEHDAHLFLKRAKLAQAWFGSSAWNRERIVRLSQISTDGVS